jgi:hypothetical protein
MVTSRSWIDKSMAAEGKKMPLECFAIAHESMPHFFLNWQSGNLIVGTIQHDRRTSDSCGRR